MKKILEALVSLTLVVAMGLGLFVYGWVKGERDGKLACSAALEREVDSNAERVSRAYEFCERVRPPDWEFRGGYGTPGKMVPNWGVDDMVDLPPVCIDKDGKVNDCGPALDFGPPTAVTTTMENLK